MYTCRTNQRIGQSRYAITNQKDMGQLHDSTSIRWVLSFYFKKSFRIRRVRRSLKYSSKSISFTTADLESKSDAARSFLKGCEGLKTILRHRSTALMCFRNSSYTILSLRLMKSLETLTSEFFVNSRVQKASLGKQSRLYLASLYKLL